MSRTLTLVSGALKNVGDFLISEKCREMVTHHLKPDSTLNLIRDQDFISDLNEINNTDALIICGGPGYRKDFYKGVYPFMEYYDQIQVPIIPLGLGWRGFPLYHPERFLFSQKSKAIIESIHERIPNSSTRDEITKNILLQNGVKNVINTGCPTLFDLAKLEQNTQFTIPSAVTKIAVSMAQNPMLHPQNLDLLDIINNDFPNTEKYAVFHRGTGTDKLTPQKEGEILQSLVRGTEKRGFNIVDLAYDLEGIKVFNDVDFHVGYRVHAHAYCISQRVPTFLLWEDGRGQGMSENLGLEGFPARKSALVDRVPIPDRIKGRAAVAEIRLLGEAGPNPKAPNKIMKLVQNQIKTDFLMFQSTPSKISELYSKLEDFFLSIDRFLYP